MTSFFTHTRALWNRALATSYFGTQVLLVTSANVLTALLSLLSGPLAARLLGPQGRGELAAIQTWPMFLTIFATLGLYEAIVYFSARRPHKATSYLASASILTMLAVLPVMAVGYAAMPWLLATQTPEVVTAARWYLLLIPIGALFTLPLAVLRGRSDMVPWNIFRVATPLGWLIILGIALLTEHTTSQWIAGAFLLMQLPLAGIAWLVVKARTRGAFRPARRDWWPMLRYGLPTMAGQAPSQLNQRFDQMLMAALLPAHELGWYITAFAWSSALSPLLSGIGVIVFPMIASQADTNEQAAIISRGVRLGVVIALVVGLPLFALSPIAIPGLFGADFAPAIPATLLLVVAGMVYEVNGILRESGRGLGATKMVLMADTAGFLVSLVMLVLLLRSLGIFGAAIASLVGYSTTMAFLVVPISRITHNSIPALLCPRPEDVRLVWNRIAVFIRARVQTKQ